MSAGAQEKANPATAAAKSVPEPTCRTLIHLADDHLTRQGRRLQRAPGMQVTAEIRLGRRSVIDYLLSPVQKIAYEAGQKRSHPSP